MLAWILTWNPNLLNSIISKMEVFFTIVQNIFVPLLITGAIALWAEIGYMRDRRDSHAIHKAEMKRLSKKHSKYYLIALLYKLKIKAAKKHI